MADPARRTARDLQRLADASSEQSFPASDPPSSWAGRDDPTHKAERVAHDEGATAAELIVEEHHRIQERLDDVAGSVRDDRRRAFRQLLRELEAHEAMGQALLHPTVGRVRADLGSARSSEEREIADQANDLRNLGVDAPEFDALFAEFRTFLTSHFEAEESALPLLDQACTGIERAALHEVLVQINEATESDPGHRPQERS